MSLMKYAVVGVLLAIVVSSDAEEAKSSQNNSPLTSSSSDSKQQNKRLAIYGSSSDTLNSGFRPITSSYSSVNNYVGNPQPSAASNVYTKATSTYNPYYSSPSDKYSSYKSPSYSSFQPTYQQYQALGYAAAQPAQISYAQPPNNYAAYSSAVYGPQVFPQQIPYSYNPAQPINPVVHAAPIATFANSYQTPANTFYVNPQQIHKVPFYNQQPQTFNVAPYQPANYHVKQFSQSSPPSQHITSKPVALDSSIAQALPLSHVEHNNQGAVSFTHFSHFGERKPSAAPLLATQAPQQVYYHQQPQPIYNGDYSKQAQYTSFPIASNYYQPQTGVHYGNLPYAHISKVPFSPQASASTLVSSVAPPQHKLVFPR